MFGSSGTVARRFTEEELFVRSRYRMLSLDVSWSTTCVNAPH